MRLPRRRPLIVAAALLAGAAGAVSVGSPAMAADLCFNYFPTLTITTPGDHAGTAGNDVVVIKNTSAKVTYDPVGGSDRICRFANADELEVKSAGNGHWIAMEGSKKATINGSSGPDVIYGGSGNDVIAGNGGDDVILGYGGDDYIRGGAGNDYIVDDYGTNCLLGGSGYNQIYGGLGNDTILLGYEYRYSDTLCAPPDSDMSMSASMFRTNRSNGGGVADGKNGNDIVWGSNGSDTLNGGAGNDVIRGWDGNDSLWGDSGSDYLYGGNGNDDLSDYGDSVVDRLYGDADTDVFHAYGNGIDVCYPGSGPNTITCGFGVTG